MSPRTWCDNGGWRLCSKSEKSNRIPDQNNSRVGPYILYHYYYKYYIISCTCCYSAREYRTTCQYTGDMQSRRTRGSCGRLCVFMRVLNYHIIKRTGWQDFAAVSHHKGVLYFIRTTPPSRKVASACSETHSRISTIN